MIKFIISRIGKEPHEQLLLDPTVCDNPSYYTYLHTIKYQLYIDLPLVLIYIDYRCHFYTISGAVVVLAQKDTSNFSHRYHIWQQHLSDNSTSILRSPICCQTWWLWQIHHPMGRPLPAVRDQSADEDDPESHHDSIIISTIHNATVITVLV